MHNVIVYRHLAPLHHVTGGIVLWSISASYALSLWSYIICEDILDNVFSYESYFRRTWPWYKSVHALLIYFVHTRTVENKKSPVGACHAGVAGWKQTSTSILLECSKHIKSNLLLYFDRKFTALIVHWSWNDACRELSLSSTVNQSVSDLYIFSFFGGPITAPC